MMITVLQRAEVERARARRIVSRAHANAHANAVVAARVRQQVGPLASPRGLMQPQQPPLQQSMSSPAMSLSPTAAGAAGAGSADSERRRHDFVEHDHRGPHLQDNISGFTFDGSSERMAAGMRAAAAAAAAVPAGAGGDERGAMMQQHLGQVHVPAAAPVVIEGGGGAAMNMGGGSGGGEGAKSSAAIVATGPVSALDNPSTSDGNDCNVGAVQHVLKKPSDISGMLGGRDGQDGTDGEGSSLDCKRGGVESTDRDEQTAAHERSQRDDQNPETTDASFAAARLCKESSSSSYPEGPRPEAGGGGSVGEIPSEPGVGDNPAGSGGGIVPSDAEMGSQLPSAAIVAGSGATPLVSSYVKVAGVARRGMGGAGGSVSTPATRNAMVVSCTAGVQEALRVVGRAGFGPHLQQQQQQQQVLQVTQAMGPPAQHSIGISADLFHMKHMEIALSQEEVERADLR